MRGAVAAGSPHTVEAGIHALESGGNAVDAAIAATLMAGVAEPLLTGLGGAGMAMVRMDGEVTVVDMFANVPGLDAPDAPPVEMETVTIDFGPTTQSFQVGPAAAAIPGVPAGLCALHAAHGRLPLPKLAAPAVEAAERGVEVSPGFARVCTLLWPILARSQALADLVGRDGRPLRAGEVYRTPDLAGTLSAFAEAGASYFSDGPGARAMLEFLSGRSRVVPADLTNQRATVQPPLHLRYRDADIWVPGPPSAAGLVVIQMLQTLKAGGSLTGPFEVATAVRVASAMQAIDGFRTEDFYRGIFTEGFPAQFLSAHAPNGGIPNQGPGHTTHISTVDEDGNAVAITHSLGETCGEIVPGTGILVNNFLGEEDVNPSYLNRPSGGRLVTMCCPTIIRQGDTVYALGSGGSSRIPTAILHGTIYLVDHALSVPMAVDGPRIHIEQAKVHIESDLRTEATLSELGERYPDYIRFDGPNMFFGGLHVAGHHPEGFMGAGDKRRSGAFGTTG